MSTSRSRFLMVAVAMAVALASTGVAAATTTATTDDVAVDSSTPDGSPFGETTAPLDPRITPDRISELDPPSLPASIQQPLPARHRLAASAREVPMTPARFEEARAAIDRGLAYLRSTQGPRGGWLESTESAPTDHPEQRSPVAVAVTALAVKAFAQAAPDQSEATADDAALDRAIAFILAARGDDGSFESGALASYVHACVVSGLVAVQDQRLQGQLADALRSLRTMQWDQSKGIGPRQDWFGGAGYGNRGRPDLSNTQFMLDALHDAGISPDEPDVQRALAFVARTQNRRASNPAAWAQAGSDDGGFVYTPANGGESMSSEYVGEGRYGEKLPEGVARSLRSYGSMTYAGFKSMLYAGLTADDPRVRAAFEWIRTHFTFEENPGLGDQGLFYYYSAMARALVAAQQPEIIPLDKGGDGAARNWRDELTGALITRQRPDGRWTNDTERWLEGHDELCTIYAILALEEAIKPAPGEVAALGAATRGADDLPTPDSAGSR